MITLSLVRAAAAYLVGEIYRRQGERAKAVERPARLRKSVTYVPDLTCYLCPRPNTSEAGLSRVRIFTRPSRPTLDSRTLDFG